MATEVLTEVTENVGVARINRPAELNALNRATMEQLTAILAEWEAKADVRAVLIAGTERAFSAGVEARELASCSSVEMQHRDPSVAWQRIGAFRKPLVAAVCGYALGGGCELALACDIIIAAENARFGFPQTGLGVMPGYGGTQRLSRLVGRALAMDLVLTGRLLSGREAAALGLVSRVVPKENCEEVALRICRDLAQRAPLALQAAKEAVNRAQEMSLRDGLAYERNLYYALFATNDQKEGMRAHLEKRPPIFAGR